MTVEDPARWHTATYKPGLPPICLGCHRRTYGMHVDLPQPPTVRRAETCAFCGYPTNHGLYLEET